jgi:hypothetical protein
MKWRYVANRPNAAGESRFVRGQWLRGFDADVDWHRVARVAALRPEGRSSFRRGREDDRSGRSCVTAGLLPTGR